METPIYDSIRNFIGNIEDSSSIIGTKTLKLIFEHPIYLQLIAEISCISNQNIIQGVITIFYGNYTIKVTCKEVENNNLRVKFNEIFKLILE